MRNKTIILACILLQITVAGAQVTPDIHTALDAKDIDKGITAFSQARSTVLAAPVSGEEITARFKMGRYVRKLVEPKIPTAALARPESPALTLDRAASPDSAHPFVRTRADDTVQVHIYTEQLSLGLLDELERAGLEIEIADETLKQIQGWVSFSRLDQLAKLEAIIKVQVPRYAYPHRGSVTTEGDAILKADQLRFRGLTGKGVRVGIISDGANNWSTARASGDLPASGITRFGSCTKREAIPSQCVSRSTCNEGTAMAEIIYDIAPDVKIAVASASTTLEFIQRVKQLTNTFGADIIVDDLGFFGEPFFADGDVARAVAAVPSTVLFVSAAGNSGYGHYEEQYRPVPFSSYHDFGRAEGQSEDAQMGIIIPAKESLLMFMQWNDPYDDPPNDYDMGLLDLSGNLVAGSFADQNGAGTNPVEAFCFYNSQNTDIVRLLAVNKHSGAYRRLELFTLSSGAQEYDHPTGSIFGHPGVPSVLAVGTINADDSGHNSIAFYSSRGPARIDFPSVQNRSKPDLTGIDGVKVSGAGGFSKTFYGTSAAAPHVAGIAALLKSKSPLVTAANVRKALVAGAVDLGPKGFDSSFGFGRVDALSALGLLKYGFVVSPLMLLLLE